MIDRRESLDIVHTLGLLPHVVEKDYDQYIPLSFWFRLMYQ